MESLSPQVVSATKFPILNPNEFNLWKMRIEQYFLMTDYSLWERLARKSKLKARGTLLMALPDKHQLKFNIHKDAKTLMEAIGKRFGGNKETKKVQKTLLKQQYENFIGSSSESLDRIHDRLQKLISHLKIYEDEAKSSSSASNSTQNIAFVSSQTTDSTNDPVSAVASVSAASAKIYVSALPNVDTLSNAVIYLFFASQSNSPQLDNDDLKQIDRTGRNLGANGPTSMGFDMSKVECYNCHKKGHFARECRSPKDTRRNATTGVFKQKRNLPTMPSWHLPIQVLPVLTMSLPASPKYDRYHSGDGYHAVPPPYTGIFMPPKPDLVFHDAPNVNETDHSAFTVELSLTKPDKDLSHTHRTIETSILADNHKTANPKPKSNGNRRNRKACFVCKSLDHLIIDYDFYENTMAQTPSRNHAQRGNHQQYARMSLTNPQWHVVPTAVLTKSKLIPITATRPVTAAVPKTHVTKPRQAKTIVTKPHSPPRRYINRSPSPKASTFPPKGTAAKAHLVNAVQGNWGNPQHALDKGVIDSGCSKHMIGNMSYLFDFEELNGGFVSFGGNPKGGKISGK
nr:ribonuclease H-like domain-containing protein [Tanacetum cinerariifolium]GEY97291.1 ribonuclease H-like domain-containing protein [Tanacetum cinerariifolium]